MSQYNDNSTAAVCRWLLYYGVPFERIDLEETYSLGRVQISNRGVQFEINSRDKAIRLEDITAFWYRRGELNLPLPDLDFVVDRNLRHNLLHYLHNERAVLEHFFYHLLNEIPHIGSFRRRLVNKLVVLEQAASVGLIIPRTLVTQRFSDIEDGYPNDRVVTKSIYEGFSHKSHMLYTEEVRKDENHPHVFFPTLFQLRLEKKADIRIFYLNGRCYSMSIMSQASEQTQTDFRKYLLGKDRNRRFPFKLPDGVEVKLKKLMDKIDLNTGSIDMILTSGNELVFLEVNPVGQFGMTSYPCNYRLEEEIAKELIRLSKAS